MEDSLMLNEGDVAYTFYIGVLAGATITIMTSIALLLSLCGRATILWKLRERPAGEAAAQANEIIAPITASVQQPESLEDRSAVVAVENESKNDGPQSIANSEHPAPLQLEAKALEPQQPAGSEAQDCDSEFYAPRRTPLSKRAYPALLLGHRQAVHKGGRVTYLVPCVIVLAWAIGVAYLLGSSFSKSDPEATHTTTSSDITQHGWEATRTQSPSRSQSKRLYH